MTDDRREVDGWSLLAEQYVEKADGKNVFYSCIRGKYFFAFLCAFAAISP